MAFSKTIITLAACAASTFAAPFAQVTNTAKVCSEIAGNNGCMAFCGFKYDDAEKECKQVFLLWCKMRV